MRVLGIDLAWSEGSSSKAPNESGVVAIDTAGRILDADWTCGLAETIKWIDAWSVPDTLAMVDAPLVVTNASGQRLCERQVGQRYGRWKVAANSTNQGSTLLAGVALLAELELAGWRYDDGRQGPPVSGRVISEVYPYTTIVGAAELGFAAERPLYKRKPRGLRVAEFRPLRAAACDGLVAALASLKDAEPAIDLLSHPRTAALIAERSPYDDRAYKHREDLIDAVICAWTGLLWLAHGLERCQVLGAEDRPTPLATIIAPARPAQRRDEG